MNFWSNKQVLVLFVLGDLPNYMIQARIKWVRVPISPVAVVQIERSVNGPENSSFILVHHRFVCECPPDVKFNVDVIDILIRSRLINMREFDVHLAQVSFFCLKKSLFYISLWENWLNRPSARSKGPS